jgi:hypothetical protein
MKKPKSKFNFWKNYWRWLPYLKKTQLQWKDKWSTPRCERCPEIRFEWLYIGLSIEFGEDRYWEQRLWIELYHDGDYEKAVEAWPWRDVKTGKSNWNKSIIKK